MEGWKKYTFYISNTAHADMRMKLRYDDLPQQTFFKMLIKAYIEDEPMIRELIKKLNQKISKRSLTKMKKDEKEAEKQEEYFALTEEEVSDIYDQIKMDDKDESI